MSEVKQIYSKGRGRGVLALKSFMPCPTPMELKKQINAVKPINPNEVNKEALPMLMAKYSYTENTEQPGGFVELTIKQGEKLYLLQPEHFPSQNPLWWKVMNAQDQVGYVPANYCLVLEEKLTSLPWLENKRLMTEKEKKIELKMKINAKNNHLSSPLNEQPKIKPYVSSYETKEKTSCQKSDELAKKYYCEICDKKFNGPQPWKMHMSSKNHLEEENRLALGS